MVSGAEPVTVTLVDWVRLPPRPEHCNVYVWLVVRFVKACEPLVALVPDHPPLAVQEVALVLLQVTVEEFP